ncbi:winged helix-turn-helix transcriptional regulator [Scleromatobacter humisilvae]|uniref:Winged helix-turn-helix transcriptional regulator n=1 Tax=Scleromatobacter humisilvae TaxID=2897159 RepID=A0A9X1YKA7_9BURK|nr:winged helix-turn-helix transcriptional regulator [Scleromatobacter humisilvae]MCK9686413.1 winged helix-turn-helix transcriptional regulator [Scleromatobacter humisilvae]
MGIPKVGTNVRGSKTGRPIMVVLDLLGRRGALRVLWELRGEPLTFRALQEACGTNPSLLNTRLTELRASGLVDHAQDGYHLTTNGRSLCVAMQPLSAWASSWAGAAESCGGQPAQPKRSRARKSSKTA